MTNNSQDFRVSVMIPAHNEEATLESVIRGLQAQDWGDLRILVVSDGSTDGTVSIAQSCGVEVLENEQNLGLAGTVNRGLKHLDGEIRLVLHADCVPIGSDWLRNMVAPFADPEVGAVVSQRVILDRSTLTWPEKLFDSIAPQEFTIESDEDTETQFFRDKCDAYRTSVMEDLGWFDERSFSDSSGEDTDLSIKMKQAGYKILVSGKAKINYVFSSHQRGLKSILWLKSQQYGAAQAVLFNKYGYDGLNGRLFCHACLSYLLWKFSWFGLGWTSEMVMLVGLMIWATMIRVPLPGTGGRRFNLMVLFLMVFGLHWVWNPSAPWLRLGLLAMFEMHLAILVLMASRSAKHSLQKKDGLVFGFLSFVYAFAWRVLSGVGYGRGWLKLLINPVPKAAR